MRKNRSRFAVALVAAGALLATMTACAGNSTTAASASPAAGKLTNITFQLDFPFSGRHIPYFAAKLKGYYKAAGLNVTLVPGTGGQAVLGQLQNGSAQFAFNPLDQVPVVDATDSSPIMALADIYTKPPQAIFYYSGSGISSPKDLVGKTIAVPAGGSPQTMFPVYAKAAGIDPSKVTLVPTNSNSLTAAFTQGKTDAMSTFILSQAAIEKATAPGKKLKWFLYSDAGVTDLSNGILARSDYVKAHPKIASAFVQATMKGLQWAIGNQKAAVTLGEKNIQQLDPTIAASELNWVGKLSQSPATKAHCLGWIDPTAFAKTVKTINSTFGSTPKTSVASMYSNKYLTCGN